MEAGKTTTIRIDFVDPVRGQRRANRTWKTLRARRKDRIGYLPEDAPVQENARRRIPGLHGSLEGVYDPGLKRRCQGFLDPRRTWKRRMKKCEEYQGMQQKVQFGRPRSFTSRIF